MSLYDVLGNVVNVYSNYQKPLLIGAVMDASSHENRFLAMKELFDIAKNKLNNPLYNVPSNALSLADKGIVATIGAYNPAMYANAVISPIYSKNPNIVSQTMSTAKVITLITALPYITQIGERIEIVQNDIEAGSGNYFNVGDIITVEDAMYGMLLPSSNTCAKALARYAGKKILGDDDASASACLSAFISKMNERVSSIGGTDTMLTSASGKETNQSTVTDMLRVLIEACSFPEILRIWNKKQYTISIKGTNPREQLITTTVSSTTLEQDYNIIGGKTGSGTIDGTTHESLIMVAEIK